MCTEQPMGRRKLLKITSPKLVLVPHSARHASKQHPRATLHACPRGTARFPCRNRTAALDEADLQNHSLSVICALRREAPNRPGA